MLELEKACDLFLLHITPPTHTHTHTPIPPPPPPPTPTKACIPQQILRHRCTSPVLPQNSEKRRGRNMYEFLERNYKNFLEIYTDGSVLDDGAAGAAFVVPEFNNMTHSFSLPAVSVYTAELVAILMALQHMSAIHIPPSAIVICSDSKAALSSIGSNSANAREDLVSEIVTTTHQLITRGTEVRFQWVPAHVSLSGNEKADRAAKRGAEGTEPAAVNLDLGLADIYSRLTVQVWRQWGEEFPTQALARDWADRTSPCRDGIFFPGVPTHLARIMHRIHMDWWRVMFVPTPCVCGEPVSFYHILFKCINCTDQVKPLTDKLISLGLPLCIQSLAVRHQREGWSLLRAAAKLIYSCPMAPTAPP